MPGKKEDRRIRRTQQSLHAALVGLIIEKGYEAVTIQDIVQRADVGRSTFYAHHSGKESLLLSGLSGLREHLLQEQRAALATSGPASRRLLGFSRALFEHAQDHRDLYRALGQHGGAVVVNRLRGMLADLVRIELAATKRADRAGDIPRSAVVHFVADALLSMLLWWVEKNPKLAPAEAESIFRRLTIPAVNAAGAD